MRRVLVAVGLAVAAALGTVPAAAAAPPGAPLSRGAPVGPAELARLTTALDRATAEVAAASAALVHAAARIAGLRVALGELADAQRQARDRLDAEVRSMYEAGAPDPLLGFGLGTGSPADDVLLAAARNAQVGRVRNLLAEVAQASARATALQAAERRVRAGLLVRAAAVERAQDRARTLLSQAQQAYAAQRQADALRALAARQAQLDALSAQVTAAVAPAVSAAGLAAEAAQAPLLDRLEAAGSGLPTGYEATGQVLTGVASWYGPGFVGDPTSSGAPYDPEKLTCAMLLVPLGTVVHVSTAAGAVNCLVNDHGPYVGGRVVDMSHAGARALGYDGLAEVSVAVLAPIASLSVGSAGAGGSTAGVPPPKRVAGAGAAPVAG